MVRSVFLSVCLYIQNSADLTNRIKNFTLEENSTLCSFDVVSMYSNCSVKKCENILRIKLQKYFDLIQDVTMQGVIQGVAITK